MIDRPGLKPIGPAGGRQASSSRRPPGDGSDFKAILKRELGAEVKFSRHAQERLKSRPLGEGQVRQLESAVDRAASKGVRESLVLMDDLALVVSVPNRTVITAVHGERMNREIFTNIDSAVIVRDGAGPSSGGPGRGLTEAAHAGRLTSLKEADRV